MNLITYEDIKKDKEINTYINKGNDVLDALGYTDHGPGHTGKVADITSDILMKLGYSARMAELGSISAYIHDMGNMVNRKDHAQTGAMMAFSILGRMGMEPSELADVVSAVGNHDEDCGIAVSPLSAALIIADKTDVRRSRVRKNDVPSFDIHDRVNYAVGQSNLIIDTKMRKITLELGIDDGICPVMDYFEIFLTRMLMCRKAADHLGMIFHLIMNGTKIM